MNAVEFVRQRQEQISSAERTAREALALRIAKGLICFKPIRDAINELVEVGATYEKNGVVTLLEPLPEDACTFDMMYKTSLEGLSYGVSARIHTTTAGTVQIIVQDDAALSKIGVIYGTVAYENSDIAVIKFLETLAPYLILPAK